MCIRDSDKNKKSLISAKQKKLIDAYDFSNFSHLQQADLIIVCTPIGAYRQIFKIIKKYMSKDCIITDVGSTKTSIVTEAEKIFGNKQKCFIGSHPLAGKEKSGVSNAESNLFLNTTVIITPTSKTNKNLLSKIKNFWKKIDCKVEILSPLLHDVIMSETSHVPHLISYSLVNSIFRNKNIKNIHNFTGGGFKDFARIAKSNPIMWRDICQHNKKNIAASLGLFINDLKSLRKQVQQNDFQKLYNLFKKTRQKLS